MNFIKEMIITSALVFLLIIVGMIYFIGTHGASVITFLFFYMVIMGVIGWHDARKRASNDRKGLPNDAHSILSRLLGDAP